MEQPTKPTLHEIVKNHQSLDELMFETDGVLSTEVQESIVDAWMAENEKALAEKISSYAFKIDNLNDTSERLKTRATFISNQAKSLASLAERLHDRLKLTMDELKTTKIETDTHTFKIQKNPPKMDILDQKKIPTKYFDETIVYELDKEKLKSDLKAGAVVPGVELNQGTRLVIK